MIKRMLPIIALIVLISLALPAITLAQDGDPLATAQAAEREADQARQDAARRAAVLEATAQAGYAQATERAQATATAQAAQATAEALQVTATARAVEATRWAIELEATRAAHQVLATREAARWAMDATATAGAYQAEATIQAMAIQRGREQGDLVSSAAVIGIVLFGATLMVMLWRAAKESNRREADESLAPAGTGVIIDAQPVTRSNSKPMALIPPQTGWTPAYLRPIGADERQYQRAG